MPILQSEEKNTKKGGLYLIGTGPESTQIYCSQKSSFTSQFSPD